MKKFFFKLASLLKLRELKENEARKEFNEVLTALNFLETKIESLENEKKTNEEQLFIFQKKNTDRIDEVNNYLSYIQVVIQKITKLQDKKLQIQNMLAEKRKDLLHATREKKTLENLKEKKYNLWKKEQMQFFKL